MIGEIKMKKLNLVFAVALTTLINSLTFLPIGTSSEEPVAKAEKKYSTELFVVQSETQDGYLNSESISEETNAPYGYILDNKYEIGDVVEVTYRNDDIKSERKITGDELKEVEENLGEEINGVLEDAEFPTEVKAVKYIYSQEDAKEITGLMAIDQDGNDVYVDAMDLVKYKLDKNPKLTEDNLSVEIGDIIEVFFE